MRPLGTIAPAAVANSATTAGHGRPGVSERQQGYVGAALSPRETRKLCLGCGSYIGDLTAPGLLHAAFVRSTHPHARIRRLDVEAPRVPRELAARRRDAHLLALDTAPASDALGAGGAARDTGERGAGDHARRRRRLRSEDPALPRRADHGRGLTASGTARALDRDSAREPARVAPRPRGPRRRP